jgi:hypothetical protein
MGAVTPDSPGSAADDGLAGRADSGVQYGPAAHIEPLDMLVVERRRPGRALLIAAEGVWIAWLVAIVYGPRDGPWRYPILLSVVPIVFLLSSIVLVVLAWRGRPSPWRGLGVREGVAFVQSAGLAEIPLAVLLLATSTQTTGSAVLEWLKIEHTIVSWQAIQVQYGALVPAPAVDRTYAIFVTVVAVLTASFATVLAIAGIADRPRLEFTRAGVALFDVFGRCFVPWEAFDSALPAYAVVGRGILPLVARPELVIRRGLVINPTRGGILWRRHPEILTAMIEYYVDNPAQRGAIGTMDEYRRLLTHLKQSAREGLIRRH